MLLCWLRPVKDVRVVVRRMNGPSLEVIVEMERVAGMRDGIVLPTPNAQAFPLEAVSDVLASPFDAIVAAWMRLRGLWSAMLAIVEIVGGLSRVERMGAQSEGELLNKVA